MGKILDAAVLLLYPLIVYLGLNHFGVRYTALLLFLLVGRRMVALALSDKRISRLVFLQAAFMAGIIGAAAASGSAFALRIAPFAVSLTFLTVFALSLRTTPIIERFARLKRPDLPEEHVTYIRKLTKLWVGVLAVNSCLLLAASMSRDEALWAVLVGPVSYGMFGVVFAVEYPYRKRRFQEFDDRSPVDRLLKPILGIRRAG